MVEYRRDSGFRVLPEKKGPRALPPVGFRKPIPLHIRYQVLIRQRGLDPDDREPLDAIREGIDFDHRPPLHARLWDDAADDTVPSANDLEFIIARRRRTHIAASAADQRIEAKIRRLREAAEAHLRAMAERLYGGAKRTERPPWRRKWPTRDSGRIHC